MRVSRPRGRRAAVLAAAGMLLLSGCGGTAPGIAADVDGEEITDAQVDDFAEVLCALGGLPGTESGTPTSQARYNALSILLVTELAKKVGDVDQVDPDDLRAAKQQITSGREQVPEKSRETFDTVAAEYVESQLALQELGRDSLEKQGKASDDITDEQASQEGARLLQEYTKTADVEVDPRYGTLKDGVLVRDTGPLSVPVSDFAVGATAEQPSEKVVSQLPSSQKCN